MIEIAIMPLIFLIGVNLILLTYIGVEVIYPKLKKRVDNPKTTVANESDDELDYEQVRRFIELQNLINYDGTSDNQLDLETVKRYYGKE